MTRSLNDDCYRWTNHGHVTTHAHFEGGLCVVPDADPLFLRRVEAYEDGGWEAWAIEKRRQRRGLPTVTPQRLPISPQNAKHGYSEAMSNSNPESPFPDPPFPALSALFEAARAFSQVLDFGALTEENPTTFDEEPVTGVTVTEADECETNIPHAIDYDVTETGALLVLGAGHANLIAYAPDQWLKARRHPGADQ